MQTASAAIGALQARMVENFANIQQALGFEEAARRTRAAAAGIR